MLTTLVVTTRVAFTGAVNKQMIFGMRNSEYVIKRIDGLGPVKAEVISSENAVDAGNTFLSARDGQRNVVITLGFAPKRNSGKTIESLRRDLKQTLMPKSRIEMLFADDVVGQYNLYGTVESHEPDIFAKDPEVVISILCDDPYFYKFGAADIEFIVPPLSNFNETFALPYAGDVPVGFVFETDIVFSNIGAIDLRMNYQPNSGLAYPLMRVTMDFNANDHLRISSVKGSRGATYKRGTGAPVNAMPGFSGSLVDMQLQPGLNYFNLYALADVNGQPIGASPGGHRNSKITYKNITGGL